MNATTSRHLARSLIADQHAVADHERGLRALDAEARDAAGRLSALTAWVTRFERALSVMVRRPAGNRALD